jgi:hypothetical protein
MVKAKKELEEFELQFKFKANPAPKTNHLKYFDTNK